MSDDCFGVLLALFMVNDPWPLQSGRSDVEALLDEESRKRGFCDWIEAFHVWPTPQ
jgi:hypothetical protein